MPPSIFEAVFHHAADAMVIMNQWRQVMYMNDAAVKLLGSSSSTQTSTFCGEMFHCQDADRNPMEGSRCIGQCVLSDKAPQSDLEMNIVNSDGITVPVAVTYSYIPIEDSSPYLLMSLRDVSERKRLEEKERQNTELQYTLQERERLARDLHDGVVQDIAYANMQTKMLLDEIDQGKTPDKADLTTISQILEHSFTELRQAIYDLTFRVSGDFKSYVKRYALDYGSRYRIQIQFQSRTHIPNLEPFAASQAAKILQEALANVRKHAKAKNVQVQLEATGRRGPRLAMVELTVADDGKGFASAKQKGREHYGMRTMHERAELLGGKLSVESAPNRGTTVRLQIPVSKS